MNEKLPHSLNSLFGNADVSLGHIIAFLILIVLVFTLKYLFQVPLRKFILDRLYKRRKDIVYKLMFHRLDKPIRQPPSFVF